MAMPPTVIEPESGRARLPIRLSSVLNPGDDSKDRVQRRALNTPAGSPDGTEWPDPYDKREDPRGPGETPPEGATSTSEPRGPQDDEADYYEGPKRDKVDE